MPDRYVLFGNPVEHSRSPLIHRLFAAQTGQSLTYTAQLVPLNGLATALARFADEDGKGANITVPFKENAFQLCDQLTPRAQVAGAVNTLHFQQGHILGDNTDGAGLIADLQHNLAQPLTGQRILLLGAGGAARGVLAPLIAFSPACLFIANRTPETAHRLAESVAGLGTNESPVQAGSFDDLAGQQFDLVINATSASLSGQTLPLPPPLFSPQGLAYDMMYGRQETPFIRQARQLGAAFTSDGLGMLVEQAAEAFLLWHCIRPETREVLQQVRQQL